MLVFRYLLSDVCGYSIYRLGITNLFDEDSIDQKKDGTTKRTFRAINFTLDDIGGREPYISKNRLHEIMVDSAP